MKQYCRVGNICSASGFFVLPNTSTYSVAKYTLESFSNCLRHEMTPWVLYISIIESSALKISMNEVYASILQDVRKQLSTDIQQRWEIDFSNNLIIQKVNSPYITHAAYPDKIVQVVRHVVMNKNPRICY
ncbi:unnamed protein product [Rotaria magnacalcarata]|uniref:Uncharacterized protein n=1 Tax=Rotaria magnacalcarata TaxID=392030 RepID=A0A816RXY4_9BILA|nr:unnamed protein product [Rotaria magnacalcarata]CAF2080294.1 unnamed protein product [Rotaria magnacalcarata]CAF3904026.1 unnamed protein product [Rotaria magnacalcarata]CAF3949040.1 unnamed protein product [Rotaria magnacalcarata]